MAMIMLTTLIQAVAAQPAGTSDLSFLIGSWKVNRTYGPDDDEPRLISGTLTCEMALDDQFIECTYDMARPGKIRGLDRVFFNYNEIYDKYESLWLSSTWPIKVLMQGTLTDDTTEIVLKTQAEFEIRDSIIEFVKGTLLVPKDQAGAYFERKTLIRTSNDPDDKWRYHMKETAHKISG